ncbi:DUF1631 family protein [Thermomonas fusca]|uniref:DUF1631 domain-containing protein n=1 Tax=Thermomonas fusca TaxID=215690 RepID=A0A5R9PFJ9_9GAMM|nr:DUF1631 family protein [Thermomonas fusca]TLX22291.1 DUF1631 domain-containing protein [Thermomonas fusca]
MTFRSPAESPTPTLSRANGPLLDALQKHVLDRAVPALDRALADLDDYLFDRSQSGEESLGLMALRDMRRARSDLSRGFRGVVHNRFRALHGDHVAAGEGEGEDGGSLSLVAEEDLEEQLAIEQLSASVLRTHASAFDAVRKRFLVVVGLTELRPQENPLDPVFLAGALGKAMGQLEISAELRIVVFKFFERELTGALGEIYDRCNTVMATAGILPELHVNRAPTRVQKPVSPGHADPRDSEVAQRQGAPDEGAAAQISPADQAAFANMLGMLQGWRSATGLAAPGGQQGMGPALPTNDLLSILSLMQHDGSAHFTPAGEAEQSLAGQLRQQMTQSARKLGVRGDNINLDGLDGDAVDLVALLFDVLLDGPQYDTQIRQKIGRMLVPYVKVAVKDRRMFMFKEHPARKLLNTVAEACEGNRGEAPQERELLTRVDHTIDRLVAEFNEDVAIFETLEQELRGYMAQHRKRFELAEKRTAEAQRGRERLEHARKVVAEDLDRLRGERLLPPVIGEFLARHANHHLTQVALRDGRGAPRYEDGLHAVGQLLIAFDHAAAGVASDSAALQPDDGLCAILASAGCTGEAAQAAVAALRDSLSRLLAGQAALEDDARMPLQVAVAEAASEQEPQLEVVVGSAGLDYDAAMLERIRSLQIGDWIQLAAADGHFAPAKVSWISPISARLLLVNRRGIRVLVASVEELAVMAKLDRVIVRDGETAFEDAMHQVAGRLQSVSGRA